MTKIALFSDAHAHTFAPYATILPNGMNSRLADVVSCIDQIHDYCAANGIDLVLFGGDMFHTRRQIPVQALNAVYNSMARFAASGIPVFMIDGNHDQSDREGKTHSLYTFQTFLEVADGPGWYLMEGKSGTPYSIMAVPYTEDVEHLRDVVNEPCPDKGAPTLFLGHLGVQGAKVGADFVYTNPHDPTIHDLNPTAFDVGFLGHYHLHQILAGADNFRYIGAPLHHNWGDAGQYRGFLVYDTDSGQCEALSLDSSKFVRITRSLYDNLKTDAMKGHYVAVEDDRAWSDDEREDARLRLKARSFEIRQVETKQSHFQRIDLPSELSYEDIVSSYVTSGRTNTDDLDDEYLISLGKEIMKEVQES
jgi:DNA repair exonuclease SbcCD nuclease subunit